MERSDLWLKLTNLQPNIRDLLGCQPKSILLFQMYCLKVNVILFTNPSARAGYDTRSIFKRSLIGLNSEFSFS